MSKQEIFKQHKEQYCKDCKNKNCNGITITLDGKSRCDVYER